MSGLQRGDGQIIAIEIQRTTIRRRVVIRRGGDAARPTPVVEGQVVASESVGRRVLPAVLPPAGKREAPPATLPGFELMEPPVDLLDVLDAVGVADPMTAVLGVAEDDTPLLLRLASDDVGNVLITGGDGAGKATLLRTMALSLALTTPTTRLQIALIDPEGRASAALARLPHHFAPAALQPAAVDRLLRCLTQVIDHRLRQASAVEPRIVVAVYAPSRLLTAVGPLAMGDLVRLARDGNRAGIHLLCAEAQPERLPAELLACFPVRLVGRAADATAACHAAGRAGTGAEALAGGGDFLAVTAANTVRFWAAACSTLEIPRLVAALTADQAPGRLLQ